MKLRQTTKRIFTAFILAWMSGIVLLVCCLPTAKAANREIESCPLAKKKAHCSKAVETDFEQFFERQPHTVDCCAFPAKIFDKTRKIEKTPELAVIAEVVVISAPQVSFTAKNFKAPKFHQSFVRNRGSTHLENCVFRI